MSFAHLLKACKEDLEKNGKGKTRFLSGNTFPHKDLIKSKGGKWIASYKAWEVPIEAYDDLKKLIDESATCPSEYELGSQA